VSTNSTAGESSLRIPVDVRRFSWIRRFAADYAYDFSAVAPFFAGDPSDRGAWAQAIARAQTHNRRRAEIASIVGAQQRHTGTDDDIGIVHLEPDPAPAEIGHHDHRAGAGLAGTRAAQIPAPARRSVDRDTGDITCRVARRLVDLAERLGEYRGSGVEITLALSQDDLAAWVGARKPHPRIFAT